MRHIDIKEKIPELLPESPDWGEFVKLGNLTKLRDQPDGSFSHANYASGLLLYALVRHFQPAQILEIGTGRGYGAFCMAMGLRDSGTTGKIITLDVHAYTEKQPWALEDERGARIEQLSLKEVWETRLDADLRAMIEHRQGFSSDGMRDLLAAGNFHPQLVYIDGDHTYTITRHDLFASLLLADSPCRILMDDYHPHSNLYGVRRLVDDSLDAIFELEAIYDDRRWYGEPDEKLPISAAPYAQVLLDTGRTTIPLAQALPPHELLRVVEAHRRWGKLSLFVEHGILNLRKRLGLLEVHR